MRNTFIPKVDTTVWARLYPDHAPRRVLVEEVIDDTTFTVTIYDMPGYKVYDTREVSTLEDFRFLDAPEEQTHYFVILELADNSYDAINVHERNTFMDMQEGLEAVRALEAVEPASFELVVRTHQWL